MKPFKTFSLILFIMLLSICAYSVELSKNTKVSILTYDPGEELYSVFGHTAIRVYDPENDIDNIYNYGTFDFDTPFFAIKFVRGNLMYQLAKGKFMTVLYYMPRENRTVYVQDLNLKQAEKQNLYDALEDNYKPENRYYQYDFFYDNCATRVRDIIENSLTRQLSFEKYDYSEKTFRNILKDYIAEFYWYDLGINILMGMNADKEATLKEFMFIPDYIKDIYSEAAIYSDSTRQPFASQPKIIYKSTEEDHSGSSSEFIVWLLSLLIAMITIYEIIANTYFKPFDIFLFLLTGLVGVLLLLLWTGSLHIVFKNNLNVLWLLPTNLILAFWIIKNRSYEAIYYYSLIAGGLILIILVLWNFLPQSFSVTMVPFLVVLLMRYVNLFRISIIKLKKAGKSVV